MRLRLALATVLAGGGLVATPVSALLPSVCSVVPSLADTAALVAYDDAGPATRAVVASGGQVVGRIAELQVVEAAFPSEAVRDAALPLLRRAPGVRYADAEHAYQAARKPNDPYFSYQWGVFTTGANRAWDREIGTTSPVTVAVLDTGVDLQHPDLKGRVSKGRNIVDNTDDPSDDNSHGTHVAGIIAASANNRVGVAGLSWGAQVLAVKVLDAAGSGSDCDIALGMITAVQAGAKVLNLSLGADGVPCGAVMQAAVDLATQNGAVTVAAAGNNAKKGNHSNTPANCQDVLAVGATDARDKIAPFSTHQPYVGVSAPGVGVLSTYYDPKTRRHTYASLSGTSMATPFVAGLAALLLSKHRDWTPDQVKSRIASTADDKGPHGRDDYYGAGRVNAARALAS